MIGDMEMVFLYKKYLGEKNFTHRKTRKFQAALAKLFPDEPQYTGFHLVTFYLNFSRVHLRIILSVGQGGFQISTFVKHVNRLHVFK